MTEANRYGITAMVDAMVTPDQDELYASLDAAGRMTVRMNLAYYLTPQWDEDMASLLKRYKTDSEFVRGTQIKLWMDGVVEAQTAGMKEAYVGFQSAALWGGSSSITRSNFPITQVGPQ